MSNKMIQQQIELERKAVEEGVQEYNRLKRKGKPLPPDFALLKLTVEPLADAVDEYLNSRKKGQFRWIKDLLSELTSIEIAYVTVNRLLLEQRAIDQPIQGAAKGVSTAIGEHIDFKRFRNSHPAYVKAIEENLKTSTEKHKRKVFRGVERKFMDRLHIRGKDGVQLGYKLISLLIESTGVVYLEKGRTKNGNECLTLKFKPETEAWIDEAHKRCEAMNPTRYPMIAPPVEWESNEGGGFYTFDETLIHTRFDSMRNTEEPGQEVLDAVNSLQRTEWSINKSVLEIAEELMSREGSRLGVLSSTADVVFPPKPTGDFSEWKENNPEEFKRWKKEMTLSWTQHSGHVSKFRAQSQIFGIARKMSKYKKIYFPSFLDFRGRVYPSVSMLHPQGEDLARGMLQFAHSKPVGSNGGYWLKIHGANVYGKDKLSLDERVAWIDEHHDLILDSAKNPLGGEKFWCDADSPWQFLAFCFDYEGYARNGRKHRSKLPIAIDGSCNGLQHFAALLRDEVGGHAVNLMDDERQDIYQIVTDDVAKTVATEDDDMAKLWNGKVTRSLIKRNVMTIPYGVTRQGMGNQIANELKGITDSSYYELQVNAGKASVWLASKVYDSIQKTIFSAITGMDYLKEISKEFSSRNLPIRWETPVGMIVSQSKLKTQAKRIKLMSGDAKVYLTNKERVNNQINPAKQASGIAPNVIHSLDAAHMVMTLNACYEEGVESFAFVHDSFGTHAADMDILYRQVREQFVRLYSRDVLEDLRQQWIEQLPDDAEIPPVPEYGSLDIREVKQARYFFA